MRRLSLSVFASIFTFITAWSAAPSGYYASCEGKSAKALLQALYAVINSHNNVGYDGLWDVYKTSDVRADGSVWDIYSTKAWVVGKEHCGNYKNVGDCINREHSFPKSWFGGKVAPMYSDAFHLYPTDGKVNGQRSSNPYGECAGGSNLGSSNGVKALGRLGSSTFSGYSGTVFEPDDEYKGDLARTYFYMITCYNDRVSGWSSPMLAGNNYPAFSPWAINLLLKWHRQDPVSQKELDRQEAVYKWQNNRNPYIDHPELVEHIWGNQQSSGWKLDDAVPASLSSPIDGMTYDIGVTAPGIERSIIIPVRGTNITSPINVSVSGTGFSANLTTLSTSVVNTGRAGITVTYAGNTAGNFTGTLRLTSGEVTSSVNITASVTDHPVAALPAEITETSFIARWYNVYGDGAVYKLWLYLNGDLLSGYPVTVEGEAEGYAIDNLEAGGDYSYRLTTVDEHLTSDFQAVTLALPVPSIQLMFDGELTFNTPAGQAGDIAEILLDIENVEGEITITVTEPFEVSTDKASWAQTVTLGDGEDRFYLRHAPVDNPGIYATDIVASAGEYYNDDAEATAVVKSSGQTLFEDFEAETNGSYTGGSFKGSACQWNTGDAGTFGDSMYEGSSVCRFGKTASSWLATASPLDNGIGVVTFMGRSWSTADGDADLKVQYSTNGLDWTDAGKVTLAGTTYTEYTVTVNAQGPAYLRLQQTAGKRLLVDNLSVTPFSVGVGAVAELYYHSWDAFCRQGRLIIENNLAGEAFTVYGMDGIIRLDEALPQGSTALDLQPGLYIVASRDFTRRVLVK